MNNNIILPICANCQAIRWHDQQLAFFDFFQNYLPEVVPNLREIPIEIYRHEQLGIGIEILVKKQTWPNKIIFHVYNRKNGINLANKDYESLGDFMSRIGFELSHGICPDCMETLYPKQTAIIKAGKS